MRKAENVFSIPNETAKVIKATFPICVQWVIVKRAGYWMREVFFKASLIAINRAFKLNK